MFLNLTSRYSLTTIQRNNYFKQALLFYSNTSQPAIKNEETTYDKHLKDFQNLTSVTGKVRTKKPQRPPFAKNLFVGNFDTDILTYPELEKDDVEALEKKVETVENYMKQEHITQEKTFSKKFRQYLADYKLIGLQSPPLENGLGLNITEYTKVLETLCKSNLRCDLLHNEQLGVETIIKYGSSTLKNKYLESLMSGSLSVAFGISERNLSDLSLMCTTAELSNDGTHWILNGEKTFIVNGSSSDLLIVFALTRTDSNDASRSGITGFLVDKTSSHVSCTKQDNSNLEISTVKFDNTIVPKENIIGIENKGINILLNIITEYRLSYGPICTSISKEMCNNLCENILKKSTDENVLYKTEAVRSKIAEITCLTYAIESMTYLTTGLLDTYENQDCELESAIVKLFSTESTHKIAHSCLDLVGNAFMENSNWSNQLYRESLNFLTLNESNDSLKMVIALLGIQFAGNKIQETIKILRNPLYHGAYILKRMWTNRKNVDDDPKLTLQLSNYLHPSLLMAAENLEYCVLRLSFGVECLLARHGSEIVNKHNDLRRIAECIADIYAMTACISRASRSYCIGLKHSDYEMLIANTICSSAKERVQTHINKIHDAQYVSNDENHKAIAKRLFGVKGYFLEPPLKRNF